MFLHSQPEYISLPRLVSNIIHQINPAHNKNELSPTHRALKSQFLFILMEVKLPSKWI